MNKNPRPILNMALIATIWLLIAISQDWAWIMDFGSQLTFDMSLTF